MLRTAILKVVWSDRQPLAKTGAVLRLLDGPPVVTLFLCCFVPVEKTRKSFLKKHKK